MIIAECLSTRHIIVTLFSLSVYIYICASRLGMLPVTPKTTNHTGYNRNHMFVGRSRLSTSTHYNRLARKATCASVSLTMASSSTEQPRCGPTLNACNGKSVYWPLILTFHSSNPSSRVQQ